MRPTTFTSTSRRRAKALRDRPLSRSASTRAAFAAVSAGTATSCSPASRTLGLGIGSPLARGYTMRPAIATSSASAAAARASASSTPEVRHSGRSRNETTTSSGPVRRIRAGYTKRIAFSSRSGLHQVTSLHPKLANHGGQQPSAKLLSTVLDDGPVIVTVQEEHMAALAFQRVDANRDAARTANLSNAIDKLLARHTTVGIGRSGRIVKWRQPALAEANCWTTPPGRGPRRLRPLPSQHARPGRLPAARRPLVRRRDHTERELPRSLPAITAALVLAGLAH